MTAAPKPAAPRPAVPVRGRARIGESDVRGMIAVLSTLLFFLLLFYTLQYHEDKFEVVAAATGGLVGTIWGYYFGKKA